MHYQSAMADNGSKSGIAAMLTLSVADFISRSGSLSYGYQFGFLQLVWMLCESGDFG